MQHHPNAHRQEAYDLQRLEDKLNLTGTIQRLHEHPLKAGGCADIWEGIYGRRKIAVKVIREVGTSPETLRRRLVREIRAWSKLHHRNVLPLLGFVYGYSQSGLASLVSAWMPYGTARAYLEGKPVADRFRVVSEIADGLEYLHKHEVVHGDLKGDNVLIGDNQEARLADFGLSLLLNELDNATQTIRGSYRWMAPELLGISDLSAAAEALRVSCKSDVWSYAMTVYELFTSSLPYGHIRNEPAIIIEVHQGRLPAFPGTDCGFTPELYELCMMCWRYDPEQRPGVHDIRRVVWENQKQELLKLARNTRKRRSDSGDSADASGNDGGDECSRSGSSSSERRLRKSPKLGGLAELSQRQVSPGTPIAFSRSRAVAFPTHPSPNSRSNPHSHPHTPSLSQDHASSALSSRSASFSSFSSAGSAFPPPVSRSSSSSLAETPLSSGSDSDFDPRQLPASYSYADFTSLPPNWHRNMTAHRMTRTHSAPSSARPVIQPPAQGSSLGLDLGFTDTSANNEGASGLNSEINFEGAAFGGQEGIDDHYLSSSSALVPARRAYTPQNTPTSGSFRLGHARTATLSASPLLHGANFDGLYSVEPGSLNHYMNHHLHHQHGHQYYTSELGELGLAQGRDAPLRPSIHPGYHSAPGNTHSHTPIEYNTPVNMNMNMTINSPVEFDQQGHYLLRQFSQDGRRSVDAHDSQHVYDFDEGRAALMHYLPPRVTSAYIQEASRTPTQGSPATPHAGRLDSLPPLDEYAYEQEHERGREEYEYLGDPLFSRHFTPHLPPRSSHSSLHDDAFAVPHNMVSPVFSEPTPANQNFVEDTPVMWPLLSDFSESPAIRSDAPLPGEEDDNLLDDFGDNFALFGGYVEVPEQEQPHVQAQQGQGGGNGGDDGEGEGDGDKPQTYLPTPAESPVHLPQVPQVSPTRSHRISSPVTTMHAAAIRVSPAG